jgi:hypothetical protein
VSENLYDALDKALDAGRTAKQACRFHARRMARYLVGHLDACDHDNLKALKKELAKYNIHTRKWNKK